MSNWPLPDSLLKKIQLPSSGAEVTIRLDGSEYVLAQEASAYISALPDDPWANYVAQEMRTMTEAFRRGTQAAIQSDMLTSFVFGRLVLESAIRMVWLATEADNPEATKVRLGRLEKRDLSELLRASTAIADLTSLGPVVENADELKESIVGGIPLAPHPRKMVEESGPVGLYAVYRFLATATHPGLGARAEVSGHVSGDEMRVILRYAFALAIVAMGAVMKILFDIDFHNDLRLCIYVMRSFGSPTAVMGARDRSTKETAE